MTAFRDGEVTLRQKRRTEGFTNAAQEIGYQGIRRGDLVVHGMDGFAGAIGISDSDGKASPVVHAYVGKQGVDSRYYSYLLRSLALNGFIASLAKGIRQRSTSFDPATLGSLVLPVATYVEQNAIADFLDRETERIDRLMEKKRRMIELLEEKRTALISHVVARGLDPTVPMKHSGTPWLGEIPVHWDALPIRRVARYANSNVDKKSVDGEIPVLLCNYTNVYYGSYLESTDGFMEATATLDEIRKFSLRSGTVLITKDSETADDIGVPAFVTQHLDAVCGYHLTMLKPHSSRMRGDYLYWSLESPALRAAFETVAKGVTRYGLTLDGIGAAVIPIPPLDEQKAIVFELREQSVHQARLIGKIAEQISKLSEYRQAVITASVTGQIDVTERSPDPEEEATA